VCVNYAICLCATEGEHNSAKIASPSWVCEAILQAAYGILGRQCRLHGVTFWYCFRGEPWLSRIPAHLFPVAASVDGKLETCGLEHTEVRVLRMLVHERRCWKHLQNQ
jgi:hypothetical protein